MKSLHLDPDWLRRKYVVEGLSTYDIGKLVGRDPKCVYQKLKDFGIPTRPRGQNLKGADNYMQSGNSNPFEGKHHTEETKAILRTKATRRPNPLLRGRRNGMSGRCGMFNANFKGGTSPERQRLYSQGSWKDFVKAVYHRDGYKCVCCGLPKTGPRSIHVHHKKSWARNRRLRFDLRNVITLCRECHNWVHSAENVNRDYLG